MARRITDGYIDRLERRIIDKGEEARDFVGKLKLRMEAASRLPECPLVLLADINSDVQFVDSLIDELMELKHTRDAAKLIRESGRLEDRFFKLESSDEIDVNEALVLAHDFMNSTGEIIALIKEIEDFR